MSTTTVDVIPAGTVIPNGKQQQGDEPGLWDRLAAGDLSVSSRAYETAQVAQRIIETTGMTIAAFAAECRQRRISGWGSQGSVSRRLRWAALHDALWTAGILPRGVFLSESATRPLFGGKLSEADRLRLLAELFAPYLSEQDRADLAAKLTEALMREHLARAGHEPGYRAPRRLVPRTVIRKLLAQGMTAGEIGALARELEDSARNAAQARVSP
jgi:hypothetical protein